VTDELIIVPGPADAGMRADVFLAANLGGYSRNAAQILIGNGLVRADGKTIRSNYRIRGGENIELTLPEPSEAEMTPENIPLDIVYEDPDIIVVNKPQGMVVHPAAGNYSGTLANALLFRCGGGLSGINGRLRPGIVHRIDKDTSGLIVAAKNDAAHRGLSEQLHSHAVVRIYNAVCCGYIKNISGTIDKPLARHPNDRKRFVAARSGGKRAVTHFTVLERLNKHTLIEARLETGRTHQIRAHMADIGHPLYGDTVYSNRSYPPHIAGQTLHAKTLGFTHPATGETMLFETELPDYFKKILDELR